MSPLPRVPSQAAAEAASFAPTTGLPGLDAVMSGVARGDNIVWQVQSLEDYQALVTPYAAAARSQQRRLIYFRFASHPPLLDAGSGAEIHHPQAAAGFDAFVDAVHSVACISDRSRCSIAPPR
jgi:pyruvate, water dikinase